MFLHLSILNNKGLVPFGKRFLSILKIIYFENTLLLTMKENLKIEKGFY